MRLALHEPDIAGNVGTLIRTATCFGVAVDLIEPMGFPYSDVILLGSEGAGVPEAVHDAADIRVRVPMRSGVRSLNVAITGGILLAEARRQTGWDQMPG